MRHRPAFALRDVTDTDSHHTRADNAAHTATFTLDDVTEFAVSDSRPVPEVRLGHVTHREL